MSDAYPDNSTLSASKVPRHVAIIMDGNGRWAERRHMLRFTGHKAGVDAVRRVVEVAGKRGVEVLTLFAFSSENWRRPKKEVGLLMDLFMVALEREVKRLNKNNVRLRIIGHLEGFSEKLQMRIHRAQTLTAGNTGLTLVVAANYGGRWDIAQAAKQLARRVEAGEIRADDIDAEMMNACMCLHDLPEPDLFIRSGGEMRISNFLLWQLAYCEMYFTDILWPDFNEGVIDDALASFAKRQRRFGRTGEQVVEGEGGA
ncbi:MAG: isoprenyl transferase [Gammaproteobacteria bacterium]|nr:isoprenyl transferase [Gammaproteobacteria bacterium]MCF6363337.1 isoprenyl transferase [Gammaproteobacteria bacterium]